MLFNLFRLLGDTFQLFAFLIIICKILASRKVSGLSFKSASLQCLVFCVRYLDSFYPNQYYHVRYTNLYRQHTHLYNIVGKISRIVISVVIVYLIRFKKPYCNSYDKASDNFPAWALVLGALVLTPLVCPDNFTWDMIFSQLLEVVVIIPQIHIVRNFAKNHKGSIETLTSHCNALYNSSTKAS